MAQIPHIPTEVIRQTLSRSATITDDELSRLLIYSEARMSIIAQQAAALEAKEEMGRFIPLRQTLSHSATITNDELSRLLIYSEARMSIIAQQAAALEAKEEAKEDMGRFILQVEDRAVRRAWNSRTRPGDFLFLPSHAGTGEPVFPSHSYWAGGATAEMVYAANSEQIEEMIYILGMTDRATGFVGELKRKIFLELELGIRPAPR